MFKCEAVAQIAVHEQRGENFLLKYYIEIITYNM